MNTRALPSRKRSNSGGFVRKTEMKKRRIAVLMGGKSSEREISLRSGNAVLASLVRSGYDAIGIDSEHHVARQLMDGHIELAFIALHGRWGEDGLVQGLLEMMNIPYTGAGVLGSAAALDKVVMKYMLQATGIPTPSYAVVRDEKDVTFPLPFVVKPACEGSTIGISIVKERKETKEALKTARKYDRKVLVEKFIKGREITVAVVNSKALTAVEVRPVSGFYDFEAKYTKGMTQYIVPAEISEKVRRRASEIAFDAYRTFELAGSARIDMLVSRETPYVIDINTSPGMTETSLVPKAWAYDGGTFDTLVEEILAGASLKV